MGAPMKSDPERPPVSTSTAGVSAAGGGVAAPCPAPAWAPSIVGAVTAAAPAEAARFMNCLRSPGRVLSICVTCLCSCDAGEGGQQDDTRKPRVSDPGTPQ